MVQKSILKFREWNGNEIISGISQGERIGSHVNLVSANDFNGRGASDRVDLLAPFDVIVKAIARYDNGIFFESVNPVETPSGVFEKVWIQTVHTSDADFEKMGIKLGKVFRQGEPISTEGTKGIANGSHVHLQQGVGEYDPTKKSPYYWDGRYYTYGGVRYKQYMPSFKNGREVKATDFYYIPKGIEMVQGMSDVAKKYIWRYIQEGEALEGYKKYTYLGQTIHMYGQKDGQECGVISAGTDEKSRKVITAIDDDRLHFCKINGGYFDMGTGQHYGVEISPQLELVPHNEYYQVVWMDNDGVINYALSSEFWLGRNDVKWALTPFAILYHNGDCKAITKAYSNKLGVKNTQTFLVQTTDKKVLFGVCQGILTPEECLAFVKSILGNKLYHFSLYDSGGSSSMVADGISIFNQGRAIANALTLCNSNNTEDTMVYYKVNKGTYTKNNKKAIPTRPSGTGKYDFDYPLYVGEVFGITGRPINCEGTPCYKIGDGAMKGRYVRFDKDDLLNGYFLMVLN